MQFQHIEIRVKNNLNNMMRENDYENNEFWKIRNKE